MRKLINYTITAVMLWSSSAVFAQKNETAAPFKYPVPVLTIEPGIGTSPMPMGNISLNNVVQWNIKKRLSVIAHTAFKLNNPFQREFNYITTHYNFSVIQKIGIGTTAYSKRTAHTFSILAGFKYDAYSETMNNPEFETLTIKRHTVSPDFGFMYNGKVGQKKFFFSYRIYLPLYPYPLKTIDALSLDGNLENISLEVGLGIRIK